MNICQTHVKSFQFNSSTLKDHFKVYPLSLLQRIVSLVKILLFAWVAFLEFDGFIQPGLMVMFSDFLKVGLVVVFCFSFAREQTSQANFR